MSATVRHWPRGYPCDHENVHVLAAANDALRHVTGQVDLDQSLELGIGLRSSGKYKLSKYVYKVVRNDEG